MREESGTEKPASAQSWRSARAAVAAVACRTAAVAAVACRFGSGRKMGRHP